MTVHLVGRYGEALDIYRWTELFSDDNYQQVAYTELSDCTVSTVWFGIPDVTGCIFETASWAACPSCRFTGIESMHRGPCNCASIYTRVSSRYRTEEEALIGHMWYVAAEMAMAPMLPAGP